LADIRLIALSEAERTRFVEDETTNYADQ